MAPTPLLALLSLLLVLPLPTHAFLLLAQPLVLARMDPIVQPSTVSQHVHAVIGGSAFSPTYDPDTYGAAECTTLQATVDKSNYWSPAVYGRKGDGRYVLLDVQEVRVYYLKQGDDPITAFPNGLRMVAGNAMSLNASGNAYDGSAYATFDCQQSTQGPTNGLPYRGFPPFACTGFLRASVPFPNCWDGRNLDSEDHHSHMAYGGNGGGGSCPEGYGVRFPQLVLEFGWDSAGYGVGELVLSNGDTTGYSLHADFAMGWNRNVLSAALSDPTCIHRQNVYGSGEQCRTLLSYLPRTSANCSLQGRIPQESVGLTEPLKELPGCNPLWREGEKPVCKTPDGVGLGRPSGWVGWSGVSVPVWEGAGDASDGAGGSGSSSGDGQGADGLRRRGGMVRLPRRRHLVAAVGSVAAVAAL